MTSVTNGHLGFVGVSTAASSIMKIFPVWAELLNLPVRKIIGHDLALDTPPERYRELVIAIRDDPQHWGALITTHKMNLFRACADLFDDVDEFGSAAAEISSISKRPLPPSQSNQLLGHAKDHLTVGMALGEFVPADYFIEHRVPVLCLGSGGAGTALSWHLAHREHPPTQVIVTGDRRANLDALERLHREAGTPEGLVRTVLVDGAAATGELLAALPERSLVVNATGLGKDRPGSPLPDSALFPTRSTVWEFNYRGSLEFLAQARAQEAERGLTVVDGWRYFIHGWSQVIAEVFDVAIGEDRLEMLSKVALDVTRR